MLFYAITIRSLVWLMPQKILWGSSFMWAAILRRSQEMYRPKTLYPPGEE